MKTILTAIVMAAMSFNVYALDPVTAGAAVTVYNADEAATFSRNDHASSEVIRQNNQNDPSIHGRRTQTAYELGGVGKEEPVGAGVTHDSAPVDEYPANVGDAVRDEGYPAKQCPECHQKQM